MPTAPGISASPKWKSRSARRWCRWKTPARWPSLACRRRSRVYRGYRVGADGVPTFLYDLGALRVEDRIAANTGHGLRRTLRVSGQTNEAVRVQRAAARWR